jgi:hypothetical protein
MGSTACLRECDVIALRFELHGVDCFVEDYFEKIIYARARGHEMLKIYLRIHFRIRTEADVFSV